MASIPVTIPAEGMLGDTDPLLCIPVDLSQYESGILSCDLADGEEVAIYHSIGGSWRLVTDLSGTQKKLTQTIPSLELAGGMLYGVIKSATVTAVSVWLSPGPGMVK